MNCMKELEKLMKENADVLIRLKEGENIMTTLTYICTDKQGNTFEVKTYAEAEKVKAEGGTYIRRYEEKRTY